MPNKTNENEPVVLDHDYDGIKEYDNPLPTWWLITFFATIIFGFHYWLDSEFPGRQTQLQEVQKDLATLKLKQEKSSGPNESEEAFKAFASSPENIGNGKAVFSAKCAPCHGPEGQGTIGPNLTDDYWIHGKGTHVDIAAVIKTGVPDKGMPPWEGQLSAQELKQVTVFVASLGGTNSANPKPPQGQKATP